MFRALAASPEEPLLTSDIKPGGGAADQTTAAPAGHNRPLCGLVNGGLGVRRGAGYAPFPFRQRRRPEWVDQQFVEAQPVEREQEKVQFVFGVAAQPFRQPRVVRIV